MRLPKNPERFTRDETGQWWISFGKAKPTRTRVYPASCQHCGEEFLPTALPGKKAKRQEYCSASCSHLAFHAANPGYFNGIQRRWKGGRIIRRGYVLIFNPTHPSVAGTKRKYVAEHRLVMEKRLGRYLLSSESVHHKNGQTTDNQDDNLELWVKHQPAGQRATEQKHCPTCTCNEVT